MKVASTFKIYVAYIVPFVKKKKEKLIKLVLTLALSRCALSCNYMFSELIAGCYVPLCSPLK